MNLQSFFINIANFPLEFNRKSREAWGSHLHFSFYKEKRVVRSHRMELWILFIFCDIEMNGGWWSTGPDTGYEIEKIQGVRIAKLPTGDPKPSYT